MLENNLWIIQGFLYIIRKIKGGAGMQDNISGQWEKVRSRMDQADRAFLILRAVILWGGGGWLMFTDVSRGTLGYIISLLVFFVIYSVFIYILLFFLPGRKRTIYGCSLFFDFLFTSLLVKATGGFASPFSNGFYLMTALYSFYFGPAAGAGIAGVAAALFLITGWEPDAYYWTDLAVRTAFLFLLALPLGIVSRKLEKDRERIEKLENALARDKEEIERLRKRDW